MYDGASAPAYHANLINPQKNTNPKLRTTTSRGFCTRPSSHPRSSLPAFFFTLLGGGPPRLGGPALMTGEKLPRNPHLFNHFFEIAWRNINVPDWPLTTASESQDTKGHQNNTKRFPRHGIPCRYRPRTSAQTAHSLRLAIGGVSCRTSA